MQLDLLHTLKGEHVAMNELVLGKQQGEKEKNGDCCTAIRFHLL
jgi:hypothetical protein